MNNWILFQVQKENIEEELSLVFSLGITGTQILSVDSAELYLEIAEKKNDVSVALQEMGYNILSSKEHENKNWVAHTEDSWSDLQIEDLLIVPVFCGEDGEFRSLKKDSGRIYITPGEGFGTGDHPTTKNCVVMLQYLKSFTGDIRCVLDVGTGSGILAIVAHKLFNAKVEGIDIDRKALGNASTNLKHNLIQGDVALKEGDISIVKGQSYDLVMANIYAEILIDIKDDILKSLESENSFLLLSGIMETKASLVKEEYGLLGLELLREVNEKNWTTLLYKR